MIQNKKARVQQSSVKIESFEKLVRNSGEEEIKNFALILSEALQLKEQRYKLNEAEREKLAGKVQSLENQAKNYRNQSKKLEREKGQIYKLLLLERNKVKSLKKEISILKLDTLDLQADIETEMESLTEDDFMEEPNRGNPDMTAKSPTEHQTKDDDSDGVEESEDESDEEEPTKDDEHGIKKEVTSDNEDEAGEISEVDVSQDRSTPTKRTEEKLLTEDEAEEEDNDDSNNDGNHDGDGDGDELDDLLRAAIETTDSICE